MIILSICTGKTVNGPRNYIQSLKAESLNKLLHNVHLHLSWCRRYDTPPFWFPSPNPRELLLTIELQESVVLVPHSSPSLLVSPTPLSWFFWLVPRRPCSLRPRRTPPPSPQPTGPQPQPRPRSPRPVPCPPRRLPHT